MRAEEGGGWCQKVNSSSITAGSEETVRSTDKSRNGSRSISFRDLEASTGRNGELKAAALYRRWALDACFSLSLSILFDSFKHVYVWLWSKFKNLFKRQQPKASLLAIRQLAQSTALSQAASAKQVPPCGLRGSEAPSPAASLTQGTWAQSREVQVSPDLGLWRRPTRFSVYSKGKHAGEATGLIAVFAVSLSFFLCCQGWGGLSVDNLPRQISPSWEGQSCHQRQLADLLLLGQDTMAGAGGAPVWLVSEERGAASQKHLLKLRKGSHHICCGNKERDFCSVTGLEHGNLFRGCEVATWMWLSLKTDIGPWTFASL